MKTFLIFLFFDRRQWRTVLFISSKSFHLCPFLINTFRSGTTQLLQILLDSIVSNKEMIEHNFQIFIQLAFFGSKDRMALGMKPHVFSSSSAVKTVVTNESTLTRLTISFK